MRIDPNQVASSPLVLVVGAGINGAAVARELTLNGVSVVVVDANDIAFGATSRSSRLIHGGLRYLERGDVALVRESLRERTILLKTAPQFVRPLRLRIPVRRRLGGLVWSVLTFCGWDRSRLSRFWLQCFPNARERGLYVIQLGLWMYDRLAGTAVGWDQHSAGPPICFTNGGPALRWSHPTYPFSCEYFDAQILSPERFTIALLDDARQLAQQKSLTFDVYTHTLAEFHGHEVRLIDRLGRNAPITLQPDVIINATGAWGDATLANWHIGSPRLFGGTKGSHFVTTNRDLRAALGDGGVYAEASDGRMVFVLPFGKGQTLIGTTDEPFDARPETAVAEPREIDYLIDLVNEVVPSARLTREDVVMSYSGVRPLPFGRADSPSSIPRGHWIEENTRGAIPILTLIGGKLTTCRALGEEVADRVLSRLRVPRIASSRARPIAESRSPKAGIPTHLVRDVIKHEWVRTLSDLVERRMLLLFDPAFDQQRLHKLARLLADEGVIRSDQIDSEVTAAAERLETIYGIRLSAGSDPDGLDFQNCQTRLAGFRQTQLLRFWDQLGSAERAALLEQIESIDFDQLQRLQSTGSETDGLASLGDRVLAPDIIAPGNSSSLHLAETRAAGERLLRDQRVGVIIVAGGEGSRLGFSGAKGCFPIGPISGASLYQILLEKVVATANRFHVTIPVFLMTSPTTHADSVAYLEERDWFGIPRHARYVFCQGTMPVVDLDHRVLLESDGRLCLSPDGHGGVIPALRSHGLFEVMRASGIEHLFYCQIDNPVVPLLDPVLLGSHVRANSEVTIVVIEKVSPRQRTGTVVSIDGRTHILEYSLIPPDIADQRTDSGQLRFRAANTGIHILQTEFLRTQADRPESLPFHRALKTVAHVDADGQAVVPVQTNAIKYERFIFDIFPQAERTLLVELPQVEVFVPLKDALSSESSPEAVRQQISRLHRKWLEQAGIHLAPEVLVEISPLFACDAIQLAERIAESRGQLPRPIDGNQLFLR